MVGVTDGCEVQPWSSPVEARKPPSRNVLLGSDKCTARGERPRPPYRHTEEVTDSIPALLCPYDLAVPLAFRAFLRARRAFWPTATCADGVCRVLATSPTAADLSALSPTGDASGPQSFIGTRPDLLQPRTRLTVRLRGSGTCRPKFRKHLSPTLDHPVS